MKRALLVIDVQNEFFTGAYPITYPANSLQNILTAMDAAHNHQIPTVVIQHTSVAGHARNFLKGTPAWELHPEVARRTYNFHMEKNWPGSFTDTPLHSWLQENQVDTVTLTGYMTQMCCDTTARQAVHKGYSVKFLGDATGTLSFRNYAGAVTAEELHRAILVAQAMRFSQVISTADWISQL